MLTTLYAQSTSMEPETHLHLMLASRARQMGHRLAYTFQGNQGEVTITFAELDRRARSIASHLQEWVQPGDRVMLLFPAGLDFISAFFGCLYAGALAVPTMYPKPRRPMPRLNSIARDCASRTILTDRESLATADRSTPELAQSRWIAVDEIDPADCERYRPVSVPRDALAFLQYTSGSTSEPKGVMVSHGNLLHNLEMIRIGFGLEPADPSQPTQSGVFWLPAYHDMGLIGGILESLYVGGHSVLMSPAAFLQRPLGWLEAMTSHKATISGAPNFAYELCVSRSTPEQRRELDLHPWKVAFCGAEPIRAETLTRFAEAFAIAGFRESVFYPCYGLAEATLLAAGGHGPSRVSIRAVSRKALETNQVVPQGLEEIDAEDRAVLVSCGRALLGQDIAIVDPESCRRLEGRVGEIWIRGNSVAAGYWNRPEETRATFEARIADTGEGPYLRTGDLGFILDGDLFVTGRLKDMMIIRGRNHYPQDIEQTVGNAHRALRPDAGAVFSVNRAGQELAVVVHEVDRQYREGDFDDIIRTIRRDVSQHHELDLHAVWLIRHASLPRTTSGKVQRSLCRDLFDKGDLKVLAQWHRETNGSLGNDKPHAVSSAGEADSPRRLTRADQRLSPDEIARLAERVESWLLRWLVERAAIPQGEVHRDKPFAEYGLDSLTAVELSQELEDWLGVEVLPTVAWNYPTPATLSRYLARAAAGESEAHEELQDIPLDDEFTTLLSEIEGLSEDEIRRWQQR